MAVLACLGKYLKKRVMNCDANLFSPGEPFVAFRMERNSSSCYNLKTTIKYMHILNASNIKIVSVWLRPLVMLHNKTQI